MQVHVQHVGTHFGGLHDADLGVHVRTVHIHLAAVLMHDLADVADAFFVHAVGGRIGNHQRAQVVFVLGSFGFQILDIDVAFFVGFHHHHFHAQHIGRSRVGTVGGLRNQAHITVGLAVGFVEAADGQQTGVLTLRAGIGLDGNRIKAGNRFKLFLQIAQKLLITLGLIGRGERVDIGELRPSNRQHFGSSVQFHGARTQRNHAAVHRQIALFQFFQVTQHFVFGVVTVEHFVGKDFIAAQQVFRQALRCFGRQGQSRLTGKQHMQYRHIFARAFFVESRRQHIIVHAAQVVARIQRTLINRIGLCFAAAIHRYGVEKYFMHHFQAV